MKAWIDEERPFTVDVGTGWISRYELERLTAGSVVRAQTEAGSACLVRYAGDFFAQGSVLVLDGAVSESSGVASGSVFCVSLDSFDEAENLSPRPQRGDLAGELLPFAVRIGSVPLSPGALAEAGLRSVVHLDRPCDSDADAELVVAGTAVAEGKVSVIGENLGIRIVRFLRGLPSGSFPRTTGAALAPGYRGETVKDFNFRMPDRFTRRAIERSKLIHLDFLRIWQARFPECSGWTVSLVDQLNYGEWIDDNGRPGGPVIAFAGAELSRDYERETSGLMPGKIFVESPGAAHHLSPSAIGSLERWIRANVAPRAAPPYLIAFDPATGGRIDGDFAEGLACLRSAWLSVADLRIGRASGAAPAERLPTPPVREDCDSRGMILLVRLENAEGGRIDIVYPESRIDSFLPALGR
jgi:flagellar motor switch/type III secretory pathway protein FliN